MDLSPNPGIWLAAILTFLTGWDYFRKSLPFLKDEGQP